MALFKCKMCGGDLEVNEGTTVFECDYCGTKQTVPSPKDDNLKSLYNRANTLRMRAEFDKAEQIYEKIVQSDDSEAEAYWGLVLCEYGIEYVEDPKTFKRIPTCHRASFDSVIANENYKLAIEKADALQKSIYEAEAKEIDRIQKEIVEISSKEEPYDVFICYKETDENGKRTQDSVIANDIYYQLTNEGFKVFYAAITLENKLGSAYEPCIFAALNSAKVMLCIGTKPEYFSAVWVRNEWSRFLKIMKKDRSKLLIPCYRDMDAYDLPEEFSHLQAQDMSKIGFINDVVRGIKKVIVIEEESKAIVKSATVESGVNTVALLKRAFMFLEDGDWDSANEYCEKVLDQDPECAEAYLGKLMAELRIKKQENLKDCAEKFDDNKNYEKIIKFAGVELKKALERYLKDIDEKLKFKQMDSVYDSAIKLVCNDKISDIEKAISKFEEIVNWKDSRELLTKAKERLQELICIREKSTGLALEKRKAIKSVDNIITEWLSFPWALGIDDRITKTDAPAQEIPPGYFKKYMDVRFYWPNTKNIYSLGRTIVGLIFNGKVIAEGDNEYGECNVDSWRDIVDIALSPVHTVGLKSDGTVVATGCDDDGQCNVFEWRDIVAIGATISTTYGLKSDGTVVSTNRFNLFEQYKNVVAFSKPIANYVLLEDGTVGGCRNNKNIGEWNEIVSVSSNSFHTVGLKADGTVVAASNPYSDDDYNCCAVSDWSNIVAVYAGVFSSYGIKEDGTVVVTGANSEHSSMVNSWKLFDNYKTRDDEKEKLWAERRLMEQRRKDNLCQHCGGNFGGFITKTCSSCGKKKDYK